LNTSWRDRAIEYLRVALVTYEQLGRPESFKKFARPFYPFGERAYTPYRIWLQEVRLAASFAASGQPAALYLSWRSLVSSKGRHRGARPGSTAPGQLSLLEGEKDA